MNARWLLVAVALVALVGVVSADTAIIYTEKPTDGRISRQLHNSTYADIHDGIGNSTANTSSLYISIYSDKNTDSYYYIRRAFMGFNTSSIDDSAIISSAKIRVYIGLLTTTFGHDNLTVVKYSGTAIPLAGDYWNFSSESFGKISSTLSDGSKNITLNSLGISNISKTGYTWFGLRLEKYDINNVSPTWSADKETHFGIRSADDYDAPYIEVVYTVPDTTPPAGITGLKCKSNQWNITCNFTRPSDTDYDGLKIYYNNTAQTNLTNTSIGDFIQGAPHGKPFTFSAQTFDLSGNVNGIFVNYTITNSNANWLDWFLLIFHH